MTGCKCSTDSVAVRIKYHNEDLIKLQDINKGDWIDLRAAEDVTMKAGEFKFISLGISMEIPKGWEMNIVPRGSTYKNFGIIQTNHMGVVDHTYCGDGDIIKMPALAMRDTEIKINDRICQFRLNENQPKLCLEEVDSLSNKDRGGFGSTGTNEFVNLD